MLVLEVSGSPYERGKQHGATAVDLIAGAVVRWRDSLAPYADGDVDGWLDTFLADTDFVPAIERWTPDLLDEVNGIADGAGIDRRTMLAYQFMDEQWCFEHRKTLASDVHHCSSVGFARRGGGTIVAQNMDLPIHHDGAQVLLRSADQLLFTAAGLIVTTGMNASGVGVCVNSLMDRGTAPTGLPVAFAIRGALARGSAAEVADFLRQIEHASGQNYVVGDPTTVIDVEAGADGVDDLSSGANVVHTNHSLALEGTSPDAGGGNSLDRLAAVTGALGGRDDAGEDDVIAALSDLTAPVCRLRRPDSEWMTFGSVVFSCTDSPEMLVAPGPPTETSYQHFAFA